MSPVAVVGAVVNGVVILDRTPRHLVWFAHRAVVSLILKVGSDQHGDHGGGIAVGRRDRHCKLQAPLTGSIDALA